MKIRQLLAWILAAALLCCAACAPAQSAPSESISAGESAVSADGAAVTVTDMTGREITLAAPAQKVLALTASDCELLFAVGAGETLVGRGEYCNYPEAALAAPVVQSGAETNAEQILALAPDVVLMNKMAQTTEQIAALESAGIPVVVSDANNIEETYTSIALIGAVTGRDTDAEAVILEMKSAFAEITAKAQPTGKTVYFEVSPLEWGLWTAGANTFMDEIAAMLGLTNAFADVTGWAEISEEQVLARDPDYIVTIAMYYGEGPTPVEEILGRTGWQQLKAIRAGAVFNADSDSLSRPTDRLADAAKELYDFVYGSVNAQDAA